MDTDPKCKACGAPLSLEVGITRIDGGSDPEIPGLYCAPHAPSHGKGYTLADLEQMRDESRLIRAQREMDLMDLVGPEVYFFMKDKSK